MKLYRIKRFFRFYRKSKEFNICDRCINNTKFTPNHIRHVCWLDQQSIEQTNTCRKFKLQLDWKKDLL